MPDIREDQHPRLWSLLFSDDKEKRLAALKILSKVDVEWPIPWLSLLLADPDLQISKTSYRSLRKRGPDLLPFLSLQRLSPVPKVRQMAIRLYGELSDLNHLEDVLPSLFDPFIDVREEGRKSINQMVHRTLDALEEDPDSRELVDRSMELFAALSAVPQLNVRTIIVATFLALSVENREKFWKLFPEMDVHARNAIEHELLARPSFNRVQLLYYGLVSEDQKLVDRAVVIIERLLNKDSVTDHIESLSQLSPAKRERALRTMGERGLVNTLFEYFQWIRRNLRLPFLQMFKDSFGERYFSQQQRLLEEGNPQYYPTLIDNFLTFRQDLPSSLIEASLDHPSPVVVRSAIRYLNFRGKQESVRALLPIASSSDTQSASLAIKAISRISRDYLIDRFNDLSPRQRLEMTKVVQRIDSQFIQSITEVLGSLDDEDRVHLTSILSEVPDDPDAKKVLNQLMADKDESIRATAVRALSKMDLSDKDFFSGCCRIPMLVSGPTPSSRCPASREVSIYQKFNRRHGASSHGNGPTRYWPSPNWESPTMRFPS
ncbi:MAG: hypothetical protein KC917_00215 [Candidatus Omnitrophica bacterium]|nr:hypothetical protein [Candidatus Omnitrophota bacterium]